MKKVEYAKMAKYERTYWWHLGRLKIIEKYISLVTKGKSSDKTRILNIGCGTGGTIDMLMKYGEVENVDVSDEAISFMKANGYKNLKKVDDIYLPYKDKTFDMVGAFDVLEHIEDDDAALKEWARLIKSDGSIIITVPAYQWLWSDHDVSLHHFRRYSLRGLKRQARQADLKVSKGSYAIVFSLPLVVGFRLMNKLLRRRVDSETSYVGVSAPINRIFTRLLGFEASLHGNIVFPFGTSVTVTLRKK